MAIGSRSPLLCSFCESSHLHGGILSLCLDLGYSGVSSHRSALPGRVQDPEDDLAFDGGRRCRVLSHATRWGRIGTRGGSTNVGRISSLLCAIQCSVLVPVIPTTGIGDDIAGVSLSPDGKWLVSAVEDSRVVL